MFPLSHSLSTQAQESDRRSDSSEICLNLEQRVNALEAEVDALQRLVCHLLEKNERLRMRVHWNGERLCGNS
jgi:hypothetical protein